MNQLTTCGKQPVTILISNMTLITLLRKFSNKLQNQLTSQGSFFCSVTKFALPRYICNFTIRYINNSLPTRKNLNRWAISSNSDCSFCLSPETLLHIVAGCQFYLDRFTWRHNSVLNFLAHTLQTVDGSTPYADLHGFGIPQGSILGPLLFIIYINDLPNCLKHTTPRMFADDTSLTAVGKTLNEAEEIANKDLKNIKVWLSSNKLSLNIAKTEYILIGSRSKINSMDVQPTVKIDTCPIKRVKSAKVLGVEIDENLNWEKHIEYIASKVSSGIGALKKLKEFVDRDTLVLVYNALIQPHFDYCCEVWDELGKGLGERLQKLQNRVARVIMNFKNEHGQSILARTALGWTSLEERRALMKAKLMYKTVNQLAPQRLCNIFQSSNTVNSYNLRGSSTGLFIPRPRTEFFKKSFSYSGAKLWNRIPENIRNSISYNSFCKNLFSSPSALLN